MNKFSNLIHVDGNKLQCKETLNTSPKLAGHSLFHQDILMNCVQHPVAQNKQTKAGNVSLVKYFTQN